jgi:hypothetical protein
MKFITKFHYILHYILVIKKSIQKRPQIQFFLLLIGNYLNWLNYIEKINFKLSAAFYAVSSMVHISSMDILTSIYYEYFHSVIK